MNLYTRVATLQRTRRGILPVADYLLDAPHDALVALILTLSAGLTEQTGLITVRGVRMTGDAVMVDEAIAITAEGVPVRIQAAAVSTAGLTANAPVVLLLSAAAVMEHHSVTVAAEHLEHDVQIGTGTLVLVPADQFSGMSITGGVELGRFNVGQPDSFVTAAPAATLRGTANLLRQIGHRFGPDNLVPLSDQLGLSVQSPAQVVFAERTGLGMYGCYTDIRPTADMYLTGLRLSGQRYGIGSTWNVHAWDVGTGAHIASGPGAVVAPDGSVTLSYLFPLLLRGGSTYRIGFSTTNPAGSIGVATNTTPITYDGVTSNGGMFDGYFSRDGTSIPTKTYFPGDGYFPGALLVSSGVQRAGVSGRLGPGALPQQTAPIVLGENEGYILVPAGTPPEWRFKTGGVEYRLPFTAVP